MHLTLAEGLSSYEATIPWKLPFAGTLAWPFLLLPSLGYQGWQHGWCTLAGLQSAVKPPRPQRDRLNTQLRQGDNHSMFTILRLEKQKSLCAKQNKHTVKDSRRYTISQQKVTAMQEGWRESAPFTPSGYCFKEIVHSPCRWRRCWHNI